MSLNDFLIGVLVDLLDEILKLSNSLVSTSKKIILNSRLMNYKHNEHSFLSGINPILIILLVVLAGCSGFAGNTTENPTPTSAPTATSTSIPTSTQTLTSTPTSTSTVIDPSNWSQERKHLFFTREFFNLSSYTVNATSANVSAGVIDYRYTIRDVSNATEKRNESGYILTAYESMADLYLNESTEEVNEEWIPRQLNVTALHPESGEVYWRGHTNYTIMNEYRTGERDYHQYLITYYDTLEYGPAHPKYEGNESRDPTAS